MKFQLVCRKFQLVCTPIPERCDWSVQTHWSEGAPVCLDLHTLAVSLVNYVMNLNQTRAAERYLSDFSLREVVNWGVILGAVVSKIESSWVPEVPELTLRVSAAKPVELHVHRLCFTWNDGFIGYSNSR